MNSTRRPNQAGEAPAVGPSKTSEQTSLEQGTQWGKNDLVRQKLGWRLPPRDNIYIYKRNRIRSRGEGVMEPRSASPGSCELGTAHGCGSMG